MIAVDTSALMAIVLKEPTADACKAALAAEDEILISAGTVAEVLIVSARRNVGVEMARIIDELGFEGRDGHPSRRTADRPSLSAMGKRAAPGCA
jgi:ribonuclease VapC